MPGGFQPPHLLPVVVHLLLQPCVLLAQLLGYVQFTLCCPAQPASPLCYSNSCFTACLDIYRGARCSKIICSSSSSVCAALHSLHRHTHHRCSSKRAHGSWEQGNCSSSTVSSVCIVSLLRGVTAEKALPCAQRRATFHAHNISFAAKLHIHKPAPTSRMSQQEWHAQHQICHLFRSTTLACCLVLTARNLLKLQRRSAWQLPHAAGSDWHTL